MQRSAGTSFVVGTTFDLTGVGALIGVPVQVVSGAVVIHGGTTSALGAINLMEANQKGGGKTGKKINAKREEKLKRKLEELRAARDRTHGK